MLPRDLHRFLNISGTEGCHERDVVAVRFMQLLDGIGDEVVVRLGEGLVVNLDGGVQALRRTHQLMELLVHPW
ncbi:hypothetical protein QFZ57_003921 [Arthrobacter sp. B1I2]|nr:hypothetical protein [Arthrobacter sp. B1I2]